ncbi:MAG: hypothetical protein H6779_00780 [Candidatus Nomurabacteria bacterium]|nr:hypothetical protein [Candidatus Nomurabacteria bacterium]USN87964.1 MAG: hypothetical protein H6779_00780 [Candidatus Nomurabacteria bacterium]
MNTKVITKNNHLITSLGVGLFLVGIALYMYFLSLSVMHVVMRKEALHDLNELRSQIAKLEASYIEARHEISSEVATLDNFELSDNKIFVSRSEQNLVYNTVSE